MNKTEFSKVVTNRINEAIANEDLDCKRIRKCDMPVIIDYVLDTIMSTVANGEAVSLNGFGVFETRHVKASNITSFGNKTYEVKEHDVPKFRASQAFKDLFTE